MTDCQAGDGAVGDRRMPGRTATSIRALMVLPAATGSATLLTPLAAADLALLVAVTHVGPSAF